jgi:hypothetical protein
MDQILIGNVKPTKIVDAGQGIILLSNDNTPGNIVYLADNPGVTAAGASTNVVLPLTPGSTVVLDGSYDVYAICGPGLTSLIDRIPGGISFFQFSTLVQLILSALNNYLLVYNGTPAANNLVASIAAVSTTDKFNNTVIGPGVAAYDEINNLLALLSGGSLTLSSITGSVGTVSFFYSTNSPLGPVPASTGHIQSQDNASTEYTAIDIIAPNPGFSPGTINLYGWLPSGSNVLSINVNVAGRIRYAFAGPSPIIEAWNPISLAAGWTTLAGHPIPSYQLMPDGDVWLAGFAKHAAFNGIVPITAAASPLPLLYRPNTQQGVPNYGDTINPSGFIAITTAGVVETSGFPNAGSTQVQFGGRYPVDL